MKILTEPKIVFFFFLFLTLVLPALGKALRKIFSILLTREFIQRFHSPFRCADAVVNIFFFFIPNILKPLSLWKSFIRYRAWAFSFNSTSFFFFLNSLIIYYLSKSFYLIYSFSWFFFFYDKIWNSAFRFSSKISYFLVTKNV